MQRSGAHDQLHLLCRKVEFLGYLTAEAAHSLGVLPGGVVADLRHPAEKFECLQLSMLSSHVRRWTRSSRRLRVSWSLR